MEIEMSLTQLKKFIPKLIGKEAGGVKYRAMLKCIPVLEESLLNNSFRKPHTDTVKIESKRELAMLIAKGSGHKPSQPRQGAPYSRKYLELKKRLGEHYPHKFMEYGFWMGTNVDMGYGNSIRMKVKPSTDSKKKGKFKAGSGDYLSYHETQRSVLKRAFLDAWQKIIDTIIKQIKDEALAS